MVANKKKAKELCLQIEDTINAFKIHGLKYNEYSQDVFIKMNAVKKFFSVNNDFDLIVLCIFIDNRLSGDDGLSLKKLIRQMRLKTFQGLDVEYSIQNLTKKRLIETNGNRHFETEFKLSENCLKSILTYNRKTLKLSYKSDFEDFINELDKILLDNMDFLSDLVPELIDDLIKKNSNCTEIKWLNKNIEAHHDQILLCLAIREYMLLGESLDYEKALKVISDNRFKYLAVQKEFMTGTNQLIKEGYLAHEADYYIGKMLRLTEKTIDILCAKINIEKRPFIPQMFSLSNPEQIKSEYYTHNSKDLEFIEKILSKEIYPKIQSRVPRISILLTGAPGVGKTSFINHVAVKTGRPVLSANIATILSSYVGESEKNLVRLFTEAAEVYKKFEITPIIVFDEAEALLYNRSSKANKAVDQMHNNVISLLLSELDKFKGILICCSNFSFRQESFDPALHRRFYMVSEIMAPPIEVLKSIFKYHFPEISATDADKFLREFPFITPAQIKNIKDKYEIQCVIDEGFATGFETINNIARKDLDVFIRRKSIGFTEKNYN